MNTLKIQFLKILFFGVTAIIPFRHLSAQSDSSPAKVSHAEPLYMDLVRDLGARKGEKEINVGLDFRNHKSYHQFVSLVEYEFAPVNRLGFEVEADFAFFKRTNENSEVPGNKLEGIRLSAQYSFLVSSKHQTTLAIGYTQILELTDFHQYGKDLFLTGTVYNPFFVAAKRWGPQFHTLLYTGPLLEYQIAEKSFDLSWQINTSVMYAIPQSKHFIGVELNHEIYHGQYELTARPQVKIKINHKTALGLVAGLPVHGKNESFSSFFRLIHEL